MPPVKDLSLPFARKAPHHAGTADVSLFHSLSQTTSVHRRLRSGQDCGARPVHSRPLPHCPSARSASSVALHTSRPGRCARDPPFDRSMPVLRASCRRSDAAGTSALACESPPIYPSGLPSGQSPVSNRPQPHRPAVDTSRGSSRPLHRPRLSPSSARGTGDLIAADRPD
jgi:hypothetical protein